MFSPIEVVNVYPQSDILWNALRATGGGGSSWLKYWYSAMCKDFQSAEAWRCGEVLSAGRPIAVRCWLISAFACDARSGRRVPHPEPGVQFAVAARDGEAAAGVADP